MTGLRQEVELGWAKARINLSRAERRKERSDEEQSQGSWRQQEGAAVAPHSARFS